MREDRALRTISETALELGWAEKEVIETVSMEREGV
jgi:hypothetical protein